MKFRKKRKKWKKCAIPKLCFYTLKKKDENKTIPGEKKDISEPMPDSYDPSYAECAWDAWWQKKRFFEVDIQQAKKMGKDKTFIMLLHHPNVTGSLHLGHTLMGAIEDGITRWKRLKGYVSLWVPGTDHAGIGTQSVVEKKLLKDFGKYRSDFTREEFLAKVWEWKNEYGNRIMDQSLLTEVKLNGEQQLIRPNS